MNQLYLKLATLIIDQSVWRASEYNNDLIKSQFEQLEIEFNRKNVLNFSTWIYSREGYQLLYDMLDNNSSYIDMFENDVDEALYCYTQMEYGVLNKSFLLSIL